MAVCQTGGSREDAAADFVDLTTLYGAKRESKLAMASSSRDRSSAEKEPSELSTYGNRSPGRNVRRRRYARRTWQCLMQWRVVDGHRRGAKVVVQSAGAVADHTAGERACVRELECVVAVGEVLDGGVGFARPPVLIARGRTERPVADSGASTMQVITAGNHDRSVR
jgi:hypothetical protein